jgi:hypothetical protein
MMQPSTKGEETMSNKPTHIAFTVRAYEAKGEKKSRWLEISSAWAHKDGKGIDLTLEATPIDGRVVLRLNEPKAEKAA